MSTRRTKLATAAGVLAAGFALAWLVGRRPATPSDRVSDSRPDAGLMQHSPVKVSPIRSASESPNESATSIELLDELHNAMGSPRTIAETTGAATQRPHMVDVATPSRSRAIQRMEPPTLPPRLDSQAWNAADAVRGLADQASLPDAAKPQAVAHVIHNGDTLERLARRYLGDERRAVEIFELNRDVLKNPHILPIGAELQIPAQPAGT